MRLFFKKHRVGVLIVFLLLIIIPAIVFAASGPLSNLRYRLFGNGVTSEAFAPIISYNPSLASSGSYEAAGVCFNNISPNDYFIPNKSHGEWTTFYNQVLANSVSGVSLKTPCCLDGICDATRGETCANCGDCINGCNNTFTLSYLTGLAGAITGSTTQRVIGGHSGTAVTAFANSYYPGYDFFNWSDGSFQNPRTDTNVQGNITVSANYRANPCGHQMCDPACTQWCTDGYSTGGGGAAYDCELDPCCSGDGCASQCGWNCPGGYWR